MPDLHFTENWNGKFLNDCFTDIRLTNTLQRGEVYDIHIKKQFAGHAKIIALRTLPLKQLTDNHAYIICGKNEAYLREILTRMYGYIDGNIELALPVFQWTQRHLPTHQQLFKEYWEKAQDKHTTTYRDLPENNQLQFALNL